MNTEYQEDELVEVLDAVETTDVMDLVVFNDDVNTFDHVTRTPGTGRPSRAVLARPPSRVPRPARAVGRARCRAGTRAAALRDRRLRLGATSMP